MTFDVIVNGKARKLELVQEEGRWRCRVDGRELEVDASLVRRDVISLLVGGTAYEVKRERTPTDLHIWVKNERFQVEVRDPRSLRSRKGAAGLGEGPQKLLAPMPGKVVRVLLAPNSEVEAGQGVLVVEAMKMQNELKSPKKGVVKQIMASEGATVNAGEVLAIVE